MSEKDGFCHVLKDLNNSLKKFSKVLRVLFFCIGVITTYYVLSFSLKLITGFAVLLVIITSLIVYFKTKNYSEASLSLVVGLLTVFTVEWTIALAIVFIISWIPSQLSEVELEKIYLYLSSLRREKKAKNTIHSLKLNGKLDRKDLQSPAYE